MIFAGENGADDPAGVIPFVDQLIEHSGVGMLRDEGKAQQFQAHGGDLFDQGGIVEKPPAAEGHQIGEFPGGDTEFVHIFPREHCDPETTIGKIAGEGFHCVYVGSAEGIPCQAEGGVDLFFHPDHQGGGYLFFPANGEHASGVQEGQGGIGVGVMEGGGKADGGITGIHPIDPFGQISANFREGFSGEGFFHIVPQSTEGGHGFWPFHQGGIETEDGLEAGIAVEVLFPDDSFCWIEWIICHVDFPDVGQAEDGVCVLPGGLAAKPSAEGFEAIGVGVQAEPVQDCKDAAAGFGKGGSQAEQFMPDEIGLPRFGQRPKGLGLQIGASAEEFRDEVVVGE